MSCDKRVGSIQGPVAAQFHGLPTFPKPNPARMFPTFPTPRQFSPHSHFARCRVLFTAEINKKQGISFWGEKAKGNKEYENQPILRVVPDGSWLQAGTVSLPFLVPSTQHVYVKTLKGVAIEGG